MPNRVRAYFGFGRPYRFERAIIAFIAIVAGSAATMKHQYWRMRS